MEKDNSRIIYDLLFFFNIADLFLLGDARFYFSHRTKLVFHKMFFAAEVRAVPRRAAHAVLLRGEFWRPPPPPPRHAATQAIVRATPYLTVITPCTRGMIALASEKGMWLHYLVRLQPKWLSWALSGCDVISHDVQIAGYVRKVKTKLLVFV